MPKPDNACAAAGCLATYDRTRFFKPPQGWATVVFRRYGKREDGVSHEFTLCPEHTIVFDARQTSLGLLTPATKPR